MSVRLLPLSCARCSAPLEVPEGVDLITCGSCGTRLAVKRTGSVAFTRQLNELRERTDRIAGDVRRLTLRDELAALDRLWEDDPLRFEPPAAPKPPPATPTAETPKAAFAAIAAAIALMVGLGWWAVGSAPDLSKGAPGTAPKTADRLSRGAKPPTDPAFELLERTRPRRLAQPQEKSFPWEEVALLLLVSVAFVGTLLGHHLTRPPPPSPAAVRRYRRRRAEIIGELNRLEVPPGS